MSPACWEECERLEAEVRMNGAMYLAALFSFFLSAWAIILIHAYWQELISWMIASIISSLVLLAAFMHMRDREVFYTYLNTLLVLTESGKPPSAAD